MFPLDHEGNGGGEASTGKPEMTRTWKQQDFLQAVAQKNPTQVL